MSQESFEVGRRKELRLRIAELEVALRMNREAVNGLGITKTRSLDEAVPALRVLGEERGELLKQWNATLAEYATLP